MIDLSKYMTLPEVGAQVGIDQRSIISLFSGIVIIAVIIILIIAITKKL